MIDGACNNEKYPRDFFVDLIFTEVPAVETDFECKDGFWEAIGKECKVKREHFHSKSNEKQIPSVEQPQAVSEAAFIIDEKKEDAKKLESEDAAKDEEAPSTKEPTSNETEEEDVDKLIERLESEVQS